MSLAPCPLTGEIEGEAQNVLLVKMEQGRQDNIYINKMKNYQEKSSIFNISNLKPFVEYTDILFTSV